MAKKSRTPPPPRRPVQAPQRRHEPRDDAARRRLLMWIAAASAALFVIAGALTFLAFRGGDDEAGGGSGPGALREANCTVKESAGQPARHVAELEEGFKYNTEPPSSGPHSDTAAVFDVYEDPVDPLLTVHALEHGAVVIQYGDQIPDDDVEQMVAWYRENPDGLIIAPREEVGARTIALTAWNAESAQDSGNGIVAKCPRFDEDAFDAFVETYGFKGPESDRGDGLGFARDDLKPGS